MRTNIVLNDELVRDAMAYSRATSKTALVEEALRTLVQVRSESERRRTYEERLVKVQQAANGKRFREQPHEVVRTDRER